MNNAPTNQHTVLGVYVGSSTIEGVLVRAADDGPAMLLHRVVRARPRRGEMSSGSGDFSQTVPGLKSSDDIDFTLEVGHGGESSSSVSSLDDHEDNGSGGGGKSQDPARNPFNGVLREILDECAQLGYKDPELAFCVTPPDVTYAEVNISLKDAGIDAEEQGDKPLPSVSHKKLLKRLGEVPGHVDQSRIAFYPLSRTATHQRYLAVMPATDDSVTATIEQMDKRGDQLGATPRVMDSETTLLADLARHQSLQDDEHVAVVRVGVEDTLILFLHDGRLTHSERLRSLTSYDVPDTVCSRVMLQQDEHKIDKLDTIYIVGGGIEERLKQSFRSFYEDAAVLPLSEAIPIEHWQGSDKEGDFTANSIPALSVALRVLYSAGYDDSINLLSGTSKRRRRPLPVAWHTGVAALLLIGAVLAFGWLYTEGEEAIAHERELMEQDPVQMPEQSPEEVQASIDSLQRAYQEHTHALEVLDSLLVGSDKWSRTLEQTSRATGSIPAVWFSQWRSQGNSSIQIDGQAMQRGNVAVLARRLNGSIERLEYSETNDVRTFPFTIVAPIESEMPEVATYLQQVAAGDTDAEDVEEDAAQLIQSTSHD